MANLKPLVVAGFLLATSSASGTGIYHFVYSGQTGAQTQIDTNHASTWTFNLAAGNFDLAGGKLVMKDGPQTTGTITLRVWQGSVGGTLVTSTTLTNAGFGANHTPANSQTFGSTLFQFASPVNLSAVRTYIVELASSAPDQQSQAYFIKGGGSGSFQDENGNPPPVTLSGGEQTGGGTPVPEPSTSAMMMCLAGAGLCLLRRARK